MCCIGNWYDLGAWLLAMVWNGLKPVETYAISMEQILLYDECVLVKEAQS